MADIFDNNFVRLALAESHPEEAAKIAKALRATSKDNAPTGRAATNVLPQASLDQLTSQFDVTRIPTSRKIQMMRDPTIQFAYFFIKAQIQRSRWMIQCSDAQVAAFVDQALREILPSFIATYMMKLLFGYQAMVKRFEVKEELDWTYFDPMDETNPEKPVWSEGALGAVIWKPFQPLHPDEVEPNWVEATGEFDGIHYKPKSTQGGAKEDDFDVLHSLWVTNEKESVFGSLWGYPRIGYAYRFWWSFWFNWGLADRHFEMDADSAKIVYFPPGNLNIDGKPAKDYALEIGDRIRSGSTVALPGGMVEGMDGAAKNMREWEVTSVKEDKSSFEIFANRFTQLRMFMLQAMMVPDQAFEAKGGTAGYNSTGQQLDAFYASQANLLADMDFDLNRYVIPQIVAANFPERQVKALKVTKGFDTDDIELAKIVVQGAANKDVTQLNLDMDAMVDAVGLPRLSASAIAKRDAEIAAQAQGTTPVATPSEEGQAGVTEQGLYYNPREVIRLSADDESRSIFMADLVQVGAFRDHVIMSDAERMRSLWRNSLSNDLSIANNLLHDYASDMRLDESFSDRFLRRVKGRAYDTALQTRRALLGIMRRASTAEIEKAGLADFSWDPSYSDRAVAYLAERAEVMAESISNTTRDQVKAYLADLMAKNTPSDQMAQMLTAHFKMMSGWRSDQIVRTEVSRAYNMATLLAAEAAGVKQVQALDAQLGEHRSDPHCIKRNGKVFTIKQAFAELEDEHPNGTLQFRLLKKPVKVKRLPIPDGAPAGVLANFEESDEEIIVSLSEGLDEIEANGYLIQVVDRVLGV